MSSSAGDVTGYVAELPAEKREVIEQLRQLINSHLPAGYVECMSSGMISYVIPLERYPKTYNKLPLSYIALAVQKNHYGLYMMDVYQNPAKLAWLRDQYVQAGKKLDIGKSCLRFKKLDELVPDAIRQLIGSISVEAFIAQYEAIRSGRA
ncbi:MAG: DUF1801 domain-containing protein [Roseiflexaceae bacterium]